MKDQRADRTFLAVLSSLVVVSLAACGGQTAEEAAPEPAAPPPQEPVAAAPAAAEMLRNGVLLEEGLLLGGQPTAEELEALAGAGYRTVVNMRLPDEEGSTSAETVEALGMSYVTVPIEGAAGLSEERAVAFGEVLGEIERPAVVHCGSGNRVGALFALKAFYVDGASVDEAVEIGLEAGMTQLEGAVREHLAAAEPTAGE